MTTNGGVGGGSGPSLSRRRGTTTKQSLVGSLLTTNTTTTSSSNKSSSRSKKNLPPIVRHVMLFLLLVCVAFTGLLVGMFLKMTKEEKQIHVENLRHKVQAVPHLLRGHRFSASSNNSGNTNTTLDVKPLPDGGHELLRVGNKARIAEEGQDAAAGHSNPILPANGNEIGQKKEYPYPLNQVPPNYDIASQYQPLGGRRFEEYKTGDAPYRITDEVKRKSDDVARSRRAFVKGAMQFAWGGYEAHAFGYDELLPQSGTGSQGWGSQGITLVDSLDTLWLMGMKEEFWRARDWVRDHLDHSTTGTVSAFETTIRDLGGLLAAYDFSHDAVFLTKALDLGTRLLRAFDGSDTGIPFGQVSLQNGANQNLPWAGGAAILAEFGTMQVENRYLSKMTHQPQFAQKHDHVFEILHEISPPNGLFPIYVKNDYRGAPIDVPKLKDGHPRPGFLNDKITFGAMGDSIYEYMLKIWLQGGKTEPMYREMYDKAMQGMHDSLLQKSIPTGLTYIADLNNRRLDHKMDHLVCFMGGSLALGAYTDPLGLNSDRAQRDLRTARALTYTCYQMYARMNTGISPEFVQFGRDEGTTSDFDIGSGAPHYLLRPEAFESFFILYHLTHDPVYREWGWECFQSIEKYCKTHIAYGELSNVQDVNGRPRDKMESFFLAETLKYLYLLQDPDTEIDLLHKHVFNTEAHPTRVFPVIDQEEQPGGGGGQQLANVQ